MHANVHVAWRGERQYSWRQPQSYYYFYIFPISELYRVNHISTQSSRYIIYQQDLQINDVEISVEVFKSLPVSED